MKNKKSNKITTVLRNKEELSSTELLCDKNKFNSQDSEYKESRIKLQEYLLTSASHSSRRSRRSYFIISLTCVFILVGLFNMEYSWERHMNFKERATLGITQELFPNDSILKFFFPNINNDSLLRVDINKQYIQTMSNTYTDELFKRFELHVPVLGIRIFASDLALFSALTLLIFTTWSFFTTRRESHLVDQIHFEFNKLNNIVMKKYLYFGSVFENIFTTASNRDVRLKLKNSNSFFATVNKFLNLFSPNVIMLLIRFLPSITILLTLISDLRSVIENSSFFDTYKTEIIIRIVLCTFCFIYVLIISLWIYNFDNKIQKVYSEMHNVIKRSHGTNS